MYDTVDTSSATNPANPGPATPSPTRLRPTLTGADETKDEENAPQMPDANEAGGEIQIKMWLQIFSAGENRGT